MKTRIAVVIPYFQREPGILVRALKSVAGQTVDAELRVVVVDDQSPVPARDEIAAPATQGLWIELIEQSNCGPGGARNTALDRVTEAVDLVAFLDSDDCWRPRHLERASKALATGDDVYFSNFVQLGANVPAFERAGRLAGVAREPIDEDAGLWHYGGDMLSQVVLGNVIGTPTVVYRTERLGAQRFRSEFRWAGEDYLFWMALAAAGARFCFGTEPMVDCGRGVNVYSASGWGTEGYPRRLLDEYAYRMTCEREFALSATARAHVGREKRRLRRAFRADLMHRLRHLQRVRLDLVWEFVRLHRGPASRPQHAAR